MNHRAIPEIKSSEIGYNPFEYSRRKTNDVLNIGSNHVPRVIADYSSKKEISAASLFASGYNYSIPQDKWNLTDMAVDYIYCGDNIPDFEIPGTLGFIFNSEVWKNNKNKTRSFPLFCGEEYFISQEKSTELNFIAVDLPTLTNSFIEKIKNEKK